MKRRVLIGLSSLLAAFALLVGGSLPANAASAPSSKPKNFSATFHAKDVTLRWDAVSGASKYEIQVWPMKFDGPFGYQFSTTSDSINIAYTDFPYYKTNQGYGWYFQVVGANSAGEGPYASTRSSVIISTSGSKVSTKGSTTAEVVKKLQSCLSAGLAGAIGGGAAVGTVALASVWIPGVDAVTAGAAAAAVAAGGTGGYVVCLVS